MGVELSKRRFTGKGEREKTIEYRFFDAKEPKQGVCRAEQAQANADDYATRVGGKAASNLSFSAKKQDHPIGCYSKGQFYLPPEKTETAD